LKPTSAKRTQRPYGRAFAEQAECPAHAGEAADDPVVSCDATVPVWVNHVIFGLFAGCLLYP